VEIKRTIRSIAYLLCSVAVLIIAAAPVSAQAAEPGLGLSIDGSLCDVTVIPGQTITHVMTITSNSSNPPLNITVEAEGLGQKIDGSMFEQDADTDPSPYSAREYIQAIDNASFSLNPGESQQVTATIKIPEEIEEGSRYAAICVSSEPTEMDQVGIKFAVNVPVVLTIRGHKTESIGHIADISASQPQGAMPDIYTTFYNDGKSHYKAYNRIVLYNSSGEEVASSVSDLSSSSIIPTYARLFALTPRLAEGIESLPEGDYTVGSSIMLSDGTVLDETSTSIHIVAASDITTPTEVQGTTEPPVKGIQLWLALVIIGVLALLTGLFLWFTALRHKNSARTN
jgi:hypothetical protein